MGWLSQCYKFVCSATQRVMIAIVDNIVVTCIKYTPAYDNHDYNVYKMTSKIFMAYWERNNTKAHNELSDRDWQDLKSRAKDAFHETYHIHSTEITNKHAGDMDPTNSIYVDKRVDRYINYNLSYRIKHEVNRRIKNKKITDWNFIGALITKDMIDDYIKEVYNDIIDKNINATSYMIQYNNDVEKSRILLAIFEHNAWVLSPSHEWVHDPNGAKSKVGGIINNDSIADMDTDEQHYLIFANQYGGEATLRYFRKQGFIIKCTAYEDLDDNLSRPPTVYST